VRYLLNSTGILFTSANKMSMFLAILLLIFFFTFLYSYGGGASSSAHSVASGSLEAARPRSSISHAQSHAPSLQTSHSSHSLASRGKK
jgi:hypothetical protein